MKNLGWGDALIAFGIVGGIACAALGVRMVASGDGFLFALILLFSGLFGGGRLVVKGIHQKAADMKARNASQTP